MKKVFEEPVIIVVTFSIEDVITTSPNNPLDPDELPVVPGGGN